MGRHAQTKKTQHRARGDRSQIKTNEQNPAAGRVGVTARGPRRSLRTHQDGWRQELGTQASAAPRGQGPRSGRAGAARTFRLLVGQM